MEFATPRNWPRPARLGILAIVCVTALLGLLFVPRVPLGVNYHRFVDTRTMLGIPNALNVLSNIPFFIVGMLGLFRLFFKSPASAFLRPTERLPYLIFFAGVALTGMGSFWYHLAPSNGRLPWDLLPMTCSFMSMIVAIFIERIDERVGLILLLPLLLLGIASVAYWYVTEENGHGEYKFYLFVQFFSPVVLALIVGLFPPTYSGMRYLILAFGLFVAAKLFELYDRAIYNLGHIVSGHSLKHVTAAISCYYVLRMLQTRHVFPSATPLPASMPRAPQRMSVSS